MGRQHRLHGDGFVVVIGHRIHGRDGATMNDHLGTGIAVGFEQHRVHVGVRFKVGRLGLHRLRATDLAAIGGHGAVERHVLRLERHDADALPGDPATERRHQRAFTGVRRGALHHQRSHWLSLA
ncbi:hypothetical protein D3C87_1462830 [compost metagenome]